MCQSCWNRGPGGCDLSSVVCTVHCVAPRDCRGSGRKVRLRRWRSRRDPKTGEKMRLIGRRIRENVRWYCIVYRIGIKILIKHHKSDKDMHSVHQGTFKNDIII